FSVWRFRGDVLDSVRWKFIAYRATRTNVVFSTARLSLRVCGRPGVSTANRGADLSFGPRTPRKNALSRAARIGAQLMPSRPYKDLIIYGCFVLNRLVAELGIDLYQYRIAAQLCVFLPTP